MTRLQLPLVAARAVLVGTIAYLAVTQFLDSAAATSLRQLWGQYLGQLPFGPVSDYLIAHTALVLSLALLAAPAFSALFGQGPRSIVWLMIGVFVLMAPAALSTSWIDWFRFLGEDAAGKLAAADVSVAGSLLAMAGATVALFFVWQIDRLQTDLARMRALGIGRSDVLGYVGGQLAAAIGVATGSIALAGVVYGVAGGVMMATGSMDPRSWVSLGAVVAGLFVMGAIVMAIVTARGRQSDNSRDPAGI